MDASSDARSLSADFGRLVRRARRAAGLRQEDLALLANVGRRFVIDLEAGKPTCELGRALQVAKTLHIRFEPEEEAPSGAEDGHEQTGRR